MRVAVSLSSRSRIAALLAAAVWACTAQPSAPTAVISPVAPAHVGVRVQLDASQSRSSRQTPRGPAPLAFHWVLAAVPALSSAALSDPKSVQPVFTPDLAGDYTVQLTADDGLHESAPASVVVSAASDCTPVVDVTSASVSSANVGQSVQLFGHAVAPCDQASAAVGGDPIRAWQWSFVALPSGSRALLSHADQPGAQFIPDLRGDYTLALQATSALGLHSDTSVASARVTVTVRACGDNAPVVASLGASPPGPGVRQPVALSATVTDADTGAACGLTRQLTRAWSFVSLPAGSKATFNDAAADAPQFTPDLGGEYVVQLTASDELGRSGSRTVTVSATACGGAVPTAAITGSSSAGVGDAVQLTATPASADLVCGLPVTFTYQWRITAAPAGSNAALNGGQLTNPSFTPDVAGAYVLTLVVTASNGKSSPPLSAAVQVAACGGAQPSVDFISSAPSGAGVGTGQPVQLSAHQISDGNAACKTVAPYVYAWRLLGAPAGSKAHLSGADATGLSAQVTPSFTPDLSGDYAVQLAVTDALGLSSAPLVQHLTAAACNAPLTATAFVAAGPLAAGTPVGLIAVVGQAASASSADFDPNDPANNPACTAAVAPFKYRWSLLQKPAASQSRLNNPAARAPSFTPDLDGDYTLSLAVADATGNASPAVPLAVTVAKCHAPWTLPALAVNPASPGTGQPAQLSTSSAPVDPNGTAGCPVAITPLRYAWTLVGVPPGSRAALSNTAAAAPTLVPDLPGGYRAQLVVTDAAGNAAAPAVLDFTASACNAALTVSIPAPSSGPPTGAAVLLGVPLVTDPNSGAGCGLATTPYLYAWTIDARPAGSLTALNSDAAVQPTYSPDLPGDYTFGLTVTDAAGNRGKAAPVTYTAIDCRQPASAAIAAPAGPLSTSNPVTLGLVTPNPSAGACGALTPISYAWALVGRPPGSAATLTDPGAAAPRFTPDLPGTYTAFVRIVDALGHSAAASRAVVIAPCGGAPAVTLPALAAPEVGQVVAFSASVTDGNAALCNASTVLPLSYAWTLAPPAGSRAVLGNATSSGPVTIIDATGAWAYSLVVTDALGYPSAVASGSFVVGPKLDCTYGVNVTGVPLTPTYSGVQLGATFSPAPDVACAAPTYAWTFDQVPAGSSARLVGSAGLNPSLTLDVPNGTWIVRLTVTDPKSGRSFSGKGSVTSNACGSFPLVAAAGVSQPFALAQGTAQPDPNNTASAKYLLVTGTLPAGSPAAQNAPEPYRLQLDGSRSSDQNAACTGPLQFNWTLYQKPPSSSAGLSPSNAALPVFTPDVIGEYNFQLGVNDGRFSSAASYLRIALEDPLVVSVPGVPSGNNKGTLWNVAETDPADNNPAIAYYQFNGTNYDLKHAKCTSNCARAGTSTWTITTIDTGLLPAGDTTAQVSMRYLANGRPAVAYRDTTNCLMKYSVQNAGAWSAPTTIESIAAGAGTCNGIHGEIAIVPVNVAAAPNTIAVAYHSHNTGASGCGSNANAPCLRYAVCSGVGCQVGAASGTATSWIYRNLDISDSPCGAGGHTNIGHWAAMASDAVTTNRPVAAYASEDCAGNVSSLSYASCGSDDCAAAKASWSSRLILDTAGTSVGLWNSIDIVSVPPPASGVAGYVTLVGIAYEHQGNNQVKLATCATTCPGSAPCAPVCGALGNWTFQVVDTLKAGDYFPNLQFDPKGLAHITYIDLGNTTLRYAIKQGIAAASPFRYFEVDHGVDEGHSSFILTPAGSTHVSYALTTGLKFYPFGD